MRCEHCGAAYDPQDNFCRNCGTHMKPEHCAPAPNARGKRPRTRKALRIAASSIVLLALLTVIAVQLMPDIVYLSMGGKPKDLGVTYGEADLQSILEKTGIEADAPPAGDDRSRFIDRYSGTKAIDWTFTQSELTAWFNLEKQPGYWPFEIVQIKLHPDNVIEASLAVNPGKLMTFESVTRPLPQEIRSFLAGAPESIPLYAKARVTFTGPRQVDVEMMAFDAANLPVSALGVSEQANGILESILSEAFGQIEQVGVDTFTTAEGSLHLKGTWYESIERIPAK